MSSSLPIVFWEIGSPDPERSAAFYRAVCGWTFDGPDELGYRPARVGEQGVPGGILDTQGGPSFSMLYVRVADLHDAIARALACGGVLVTPPTKVPELESMFAVVTDPTQNRLGFYWEPDAPADRSHGAGRSDQLPEP